MNEAIVYIAAAIFALSVFPIHVYNYIYVNTEEKFASINVTLFRFFRIYNINSIRNKPNEMQINGKNKKMNSDILKMNFYRMFNKLCIYKVVQLCDFGMKNQDNAYAALAQSGLTTAIYKFLQINGNYSKLKNYTVLNEEHNYIRYYAKAVTVINVLVIVKIFLIFALEKLNELKN